MSDEELDQAIKTIQKLIEILYPEHAASYEKDVTRLRQELTRSQQISGVSAALADMAEMSYSISVQEVQEVDRVLSAENLITISALRAGHSRRAKRLLGKRKLKNEDDAILLKGLLDSNLLNDEDAAKAILLIESFEG